MSKYYQDDIGIFTNCYTRVTQRVKGGNNISWTEI